MSDPQGLPPYRYGPQPQSRSEPPTQVSPSGADDPGTAGYGEGPAASGPPPTGVYQPGTPLPGADQPGTPPPDGPPAHPQIPQQVGGQPGYGYPPGQPGGYPYRTPEAPTNSLAVASLVLGILTPVGCVPGVLAIIFGIVALVQIPERRQKGRGLAIGGIAATGGWVVLGAIVAIVAVMLDDGSRHTPVDRLEVGQCVESLPADDEEVADIVTVDCDVPHVAEVYAVFDLGDREWPGEDFVVGEADDGCYERLQQDLPDAYADPDVGVYYLIPSEGSWTFGDREIVCMAEFLDGTRTGSLFDIDNSMSDADGGTRRTPVDRLEVGQCIQTLPDKGEVTDIATVECDVPHEGEIYAEFDLADREWPGWDLVIAEADDGCHERLQQDLPDAYADPDVEVHYVYPSRESWAVNDRKVICMAEFLDGTRTGSLFD